jgi:hypothetical protein
VALPTLGSQGRFSRTIRKINSRTSVKVDRLPTGLLTLEIRFQYKESAPVPTHHRFGRDRNEGLLPCGPELTDADPQELAEQAALGGTGR